MTVEVKDGKTILKGVVDSLQEKEFTERVVAGVRGVREVENSIPVEYKRQRPDSEIRKEIYETLRWDTLVDHGLIDVEVPGPVTYEPYTKDGYDYQPYFSFKSDREILEDVRDELWWSLEPVRGLGPGGCVRGGRHGRFDRERGYPGGGAGCSGKRL